MKGTRCFVRPPGLLVAVFDWSVKASTAAVHLSNWLRPLQLPQLTKGWFINSVWFVLGAELSHPWKICKQIRTVNSRFCKLCRVVYDAC